MNAIECTTAGLIKALTVSAPDKSTARQCATFGTIPPVRWVEDVDTGERVGWMRQDGPLIEWKCGSRIGSARNEADALAQIGTAVLEDRRMRSEHERGQAEIDALPEPLRSLRIEVEHQKVLVELERQRNVLRADDLAAAEEAYRNAVMAYDAAERQAAEAA